MLEYLSLGSAGWGDELLLGFLTTIALAICVFIFGFIISLFCILGLTFYPKSKYLIIIYTTLFRGLPELLILYYFFFSLPEAVDFVSGLLGYSGSWSPEPFLISLVSLGLVAGAYLTEGLRGTLSCINKSQIESAQSLGMTKWTIFWKIIFVQMIARAFPILSNIWQCVFKDTALASLIGVTEIMRVAQVADRVIFEPFLLFGFVGICFILAYIVSESILKRMRGFFPWYQKPSYNLAKELII